MKIQIRDATYETNSSSSHSITISPSDVLDQAFQQEQLRDAVILLKEGEHGYSDWTYRYASPEGKLAYVIVAAAGGFDVESRVKAGEVVDVIPLIYEKGLVKEVLDFIWDEYHCRVQFLSDGYGYLGDQELDVEALLNNKAVFRRLLMSSGSHIDIGRDEGDGADWYIESDLGQQPKFKEAIVERSLPFSFEIKREGKSFIFSDSTGFELAGKLKERSHFDQPCDPLRGTAHANAHFKALSLGPVQAAALQIEPDSQLDHQVRHIAASVFDWNNRDDLVDEAFLLTLAPDFDFKVYEGCEKMITAYHFHEKDFSMVMECDEATLLHARNRMSSTILPSST
jgi:hypothetical protein